MIVNDIITVSETNNNQSTLQNESMNIFPSITDNTDEKQDSHEKTQSRWEFLRSVLHEKMDLIFGPAIIVVPQLFCLPQLIFSSTMDCRNFDNKAIRYSLMISLIIFYIPLVTSFLIYVKTSSVYYAHFRLTNIGKKVIKLRNYCRSKNLKQAITYTEASQYIISDAKKPDNSKIDVHATITNLN